MIILSLELYFLLTFTADDFVARVLKFIEKISIFLDPAAIALLSLVLLHKTFNILALVCTVQFIMEVAVELFTVVITSAALSQYSLPMG